MKHRSDMNDFPVTVDTRSGAFDAIFASHTKLHLRIPRHVRPLIMQKISGGVLPVPKILNYIRPLQNGINVALEDLPTKHSVEDIKQEGIVLQRQVQQVLERLDDMPTKQDFQVLKENEERLRKCLYIAITTIFILVGGILIKTINTCQMTTTTCKEASINHNGMSDKYILGTLGDTWLHNHTDLLLMSEGEGWTFLYNPLEFNMSTFVGYNNYVIRESPAQRLQKDNVLEGVNLISSTKLTVFVHYGRQSDATFSIPTDKCSDQYIIPMHTFCKNSKGKISIFAPHNAADITIKLVTSGSVKFKGNMYNPGDEISIRVRRNQILTIDHDVSLAGTAILSSTPVCVLAGIEWKGNGNTYKPVVSTVLPSMHLSRSYIVPNVVGKWSKVQLISTADNNNVVIDSYYDERDQQILKTSESYEIDLVGRQPIIITGSQDFVVTVLVSHTTVDPFLLWIVGIDQYKSLYRFYIPWYDNTFIHEIYVICKSRYRNDLRLNDALVYPISDSTVVFDVGDEGYEGFRVKVQCCKNYVIEHKFGKTLGLYVYGYPGDVRVTFPVLWLSSRHISTLKLGLTLEF